MKRSSNRTSPAVPLALNLALAFIVAGALSVAAQETGASGSWNVDERDVPPPAGASEQLQAALAAAPAPNVAASKQQTPQGDEQWLVMQKATANANLDQIASGFGVSGLLEEAGISSAGPVETRRRTADGDLLVWDLLFPQGAGYGMPFFIDWRESPHPAKTTPVGGELLSFAISTPDAGELGAVLAGLGLGVEVSEGEPETRVVIEGAKGAVELVSTEESRGLQPGSRR